MKVTAEFLKEVIVYAAHFEEIAELFSLTEEQKRDPDAGLWVIDRIKQLQQGYIIRKGITEREQFKPKSVLPPIGDPVSPIEIPTTKEYK